VQTLSKQAEYLSHAGKHDELLRFTIPLKLTALNLCVHGSQRANNMTNIKDLSQEPSNCFMSQTAMLRRGKTQRGRHFRGGRRINTSLSAHRAEKS